jgi:GGDEF domain-containing protein
VGTDAHRIALALASALSALLLAGLGSWFRHGARQSAAHQLTVSALVLTGANAIGAMVVLADPRQGLLVVPVVVAAGSLVFSGPWLAATLGVLAASWSAGAVAVAGAGAGAGAGWLPYGLGLLAATVTACALYVLGARSLAELLAARGAADAEAVRDELTGCVNPRGLMMFAVQILEAARRQGDAVHCLFLAVDGISHVTEVFGDEAGEDLLVAAADALRVTTRATDVVARWDTDVFVVLGPGRGTPVLQIERRVTAGLPMLTAPAGPGPRVMAAAALLAPWDAGTIDSLLHKGAEQLAGRRSMRRRAADARPAAPARPFTAT